MKKLIAALCTIAGLMGVAETAGAAPVTLEFSDNPMPALNPSAYAQHNIDVNTNKYFRNKYGVDFNNAYLFYSVPRETASVSGFGLANGTLSRLFARNTVGRINFVDTTSFLTFDYVALLATTFKAFAVDGTELGSFTASPQDGDHAARGTQSFKSGRGAIAYMTFTSTGGFGTVNKLSYDFDGQSDGTNHPTVPEPEALALLLAGLATCGRLIQRRKR